MTSRAFATQVEAQLATYGATGLDLIPWVLPLAGLLYAVDTDTDVIQASRLLERSAVHASEESMTSEAHRRYGVRFLSRRWAWCSQRQFVLRQGDGLEGLSVIGRIRML